MPIITVDNLISAVRQKMDEDNSSSLKDNEDILPALNRAQDYASNILSRHYESPMLTHVDVTTVNGQQDYIIPEEAFEQRLEKVEVKSGTTFYPVKRVDYRDATAYENTLSTSIPYYYYVIGDRYRLLPASNASFPLRIWYSVDPLALVKQQGRVTLVNSASNYILVDNIGTDLSTEVDQLDSYVNIVDGQTGKRKASFQIKSTSGNKITFKTSPSRSSVQNITIDTDMTDLSINTNNTGADYEISPDDYICVISGSCVPFFKKPFSNFMISYAVAELQRKLGGSSGQEQQLLDKLEEQVERSWAGRESTLRVKRTSNWNYNSRRRYRNRW